MPGYHERLRNLDGTRYLLRDFTVYGCHTRSELPPSHARSYDNERRRIEALLGNTLVWQYGKTGKQFFVSADASKLASNPLHRMYRLCSFTDNDIILHFYLLDALADGQEKDFPTLLKEVSNASGIIFEDMTVRRKLNAYVKFGLLETRKQSKSILYRAAHSTLRDVLPDDAGVSQWLSFFREAMPLGCIADELMMREYYHNDFIRFKHHFFMYTLDDAECIHVLEAMHAHQAITCTMESQKKAGTSYAAVFLPVLIRISEQTGRRYVIGWDTQECRIRSFRLDLMHNAAHALPPENADELIERVLAAIPKVWGISIDSEKLEHLSMTLRINPTTEPYILARLKKEGRGGTVTKVGERLYRFDIDVWDSNEMMHWVKTFTGRIVSLESDNQIAVQRFYNDMRRMNDMYGGE